MSQVLTIRQLEIDEPKVKQVVKVPELVLSEGEILGIVGESGSGKSVTVKTAIGLLPKTLRASYQEISLFGKNPYQLSANELRSLIGKTVGFIPQNTVEYLHPLLPIEKQLIDGYMTQGYGDKQAAIKRAIEMLTAVGIQNPPQLLKQLPQELSGGMRQRVNIAMAMMCDPKLIIADEPTTALDAEVQHQVMELLASIHRKTTNTMIIISHDLSLIKAYSDRVVVMYQGNIQETGTVEEIFENPQAYYTKALLAVNLTLDQDPDEPLKDISYFMERNIIL